MLPGGGTIKRRWVQRYNTLPPSEATARKLCKAGTPLRRAARRTIGASARPGSVEEGRFYLLHVERGRFDYPELKKRVIFLAERFLSQCASLSRIPGQARHLSRSSGTICPDAGP